MRAVGLKIDYVPLRHIVGKAGLMIDGDWVESKDQDPDGDIRLLQLADIGVGDFLDRSSRYMTSSKANQLKCTYLQKGDILVARMPDPIGRACQFPGGSQPCVTVVDICVLRPDSNVADPRYVTYILNSSDVKNQLDRFVKGATRQRISRTNLEQIPIPLPPLQEQRRIAAILDQADALRAKRREALAQLDSLTQSIFMEMFGDPVSNPKGWEWEKLENCFQFKTGKLDSNAAVENGKYPFFTCSKEDLQIDTFAFDCEALLLAGNNASADYSVKHYKGKFNAYQRTYVITLRNQNNSYEYAAFVLENQLAELKRLSKGSSTKYLTLELLNRIRIPIPPVNLQHQFTTRIAELNLLRNTFRASQNELDALFASLQHRAFRGEL